LNAILFERPQNNGFDSQEKELLPIARCALNEWIANTDYQQVLAIRGGAELYVRDLATGLLDREHIPIVYSTGLGDVARELRAASIPVVDNLDALAIPPDLTDEDTPVDPATAYGISKYDQERLVIIFGKQTGIPTVALRYFVNYGPRQSVHNPYTGVCSIFSSRILNNRPIIIYEDGNQTRDFIFVRDVARANLFVLEEPRADFGVFNVATGQATTIRALAGLLQECLGKEGKLEFPARFRPGEVRHMVAGVSRLAHLGFRAECSVQEGLQRYVEWLATQGPLPEHFGDAEKALTDAGVVRSAT
jgi:dTDP-L-rhamnose 4-epimerase